MSIPPKKNKIRIGVEAAAILTALVLGGVASKTIFQSGAATATLAQRYGILQAQAKSQRAGVVPFLGPFKIGNCGPEVRLMEGALKRVHMRKGVARNCYGPATARDVANLQRSVHYKVTGRYNLAIHNILVKKHGYTAKARAELYYIVAQRARKQIQKTVLVAAAHSYLVGRCCLAYSQSSSRQNLSHWPLLPPATDCSGFATWIAYQSGYGPRVGYSGPGSVVGYTGTLSVLGHVVPPNGPLQIGDLVFYGSGWPWGHVSVYIGHGLVISHGSTGIVEVPWTYLFGYSAEQVRRYF